ncbi:MAG: hypothetical protein RB292_00275 [Patescibacteria group bacterium]|jgi:dephospho-CoA kinase|nr:hypothetical protein [Patescibacteria group bacterium]
MPRKLKHKIIVFTGPIASGKSTVKFKLEKILENLGLTYQEISTTKDLEIPFAIAQGLIIPKKLYSRQELVKLMAKLYQRFGRQLGTKLLYRYLRQADEQKIYIIDSKRNPSGLKEIKKLFDNYIIIGVTATIPERLKRFQSRQRLIDQKTKNPMAMFMAEEKLFEINQALRLSDLLVENHRALPETIDVALVKILADKKFIASPSRQNPSPLPQTKVISNHRGKLISPTEVVKTLNQFVKKHRLANIFVVQGGNRYIETIFKQAKTKVRSVKLICLSKVKISTILNSLISPDERVSKLTSGQQASILTKIKLLTNNERLKLTRLVANQYPRISINDLLEYENLNGLINLFANFKVATPFSYPADDRQITTEFRQSINIIDQPRFTTAWHDIIKIIFENTEFYQTIKSSKIIFFDDVFYRGRTFFTISVLMKIFGVGPKHWQLVTICSDIQSRHINHPQITVIKPDRLYPFENSIKTERGYWSIVTGGNFFKFYDLNEYYSYLSLLDPRQGINQTDWLKIQKKIIAQIPGCKLPTATKISLLNFFIFKLAYRQNLGVKYLVDQRSQDLGWCVPLVELIDSFIPQDKAAWQRWRFKQEIAKYLDALKRISKKDDTIKQAASIYRQNHLSIDRGLIEKYVKN